MHKVAIIGCGLTATEKYLPNFRQLKGREEIAGIYDLDDATLECAATRLGISRTYTNFAELASSQDPDVVVFCTPPTTHRPLALQAMASDAHVLIDKSMALSGSECDEMIAVSQRQGRKALPRRSRLDRADPEYLKDAGRCPQTRGLCCRV